MSLKTLQLEKFHLELASEELGLKIELTMDIRFPSGWTPSLDNDDMVKALASGYTWVSRGRRCRADFQIFFDDKPLDWASRISVLESLGYHVRDAHLWPQLALSTSLEISQSIQIAELAADISIYIDHGIFSPNIPPKAWLLDNIGIKAPESVLCAEFERLHIRLDFHQILKKSRPAVKRPKSRPQDPGSPDMMLLDYSSGLEEEFHVKSFEQTVNELSEGLSHTINKCFDSVKSESSAEFPHLLDEMLLPSVSRTAGQDSCAISTASAVFEDIQTRKPRGQGFLFPKETTDTLKSCVDAHSGNLNSTREDNMDLVKQSGWPKNQVQNWFKTARDRQRKSSKAQTNKNGNILSPHGNDLMAALIQKESVENDMLLSQPEEEMLFDQILQYPEDEMLLSRITSTLPSLTSQSSILSSISSMSSTPCLKRPAVDEIDESNHIASLPILPLTPTNKLTSIALQTIIAGPSHRKRDLQGTTIRKPSPSASLSVLVPSMFNPGFKELMAQNAKFLPTISNAICVSWVKNVQGVHLRQKLVALSRSRVSEYCEGGGDEGSEERLVRVVQGRLWTMMQRALYDEGAVKKLWKNDDGPGAENTTMNEEVYEYEDLLGENGGYNIDAEEKNLEDVIGEEFMDDDEELLFDDLQRGNEDHDSDDGLLDYLENQEKLSVEAETDEMLFGTDWEEIRRGKVEEYEENEILLLDGIGQEESMLL